MTSEGFNFDQKLGVLPTCVDEAHPAKYDPVTCGEVSLSEHPPTYLNPEIISESVRVC